MPLPDVKEIVKMYTKLGISQKKLAEDIGVNAILVCINILRGFKRAGN